MPATVDGTIAIKGVTPTLSTVTLPEGSDTVTVTGSGESQTIQATAASLKGTDLTTSVAWSVLPADVGVSIDAAGVITVDNKAKAGNYTITAAPKDDKVQGEAQSATLTVVRDRKPGHILSPESKTVEIPVQGTHTANISTGVYDQFGEIMDDASVTFDYSALDNVSGVTVTRQNNMLSVAVGPDAKNAIPSSQNYTIKMSYEGLEDRNVQLTIRRAAAEVKSVVIDGAATIAVPTKAEAQKEIPYTATVQDQYGTVLTGKTVTWSIEDTAPNGVTIDEDSGKVTILPAAAKNTFDENNQLTFTVKATCEGKSATKVVTLKREPSTVASASVEGGASVVFIPVGDQAVTTEFYAMGTDQYGQPMGDRLSGVEWSITPANISGVSIDENTGELTVTKDAAEKITTTAGQEFTITARYSTEVSAVKTITVKRAESVATSLTVALKDPNQRVVEVPGSDNTAGVDIEFTATVKDQYGAAMSDTGVTWTLLKDGNAVKDDNTVISVSLTRTVS